MAASRGLHWADYLVFISFLLISVAIGVYHAFSGGKQRTTSEFLVANRKLQIIPTMLSLVMSFMSAIMVLGVSSEMYLYGIEYVSGLAGGLILGLILIERIAVPWLYPLKLTSSFEYLERRFESKAVRATGSFMGILGGIMYIGIAIFAPSTALEAATGIPLTVSVPVIAIVTTVYTALGGMRAVVWTDVFQGIVFTIGVMGILIRAWVVVGSKNPHDVAKEGHRMHWFTWSVDPTLRHNFWMLLFGFASTFFYMYGINQASVQRYSSTSTMRGSRLVILTGIPFAVINNVLTAAAGILIYVFFTTARCDPLVNGDISTANQILPYFVMLSFEDYKGFLGLTLAVLYSGALSSVSSSLSGCAANIWEDLLKPKLEHRLSELRAAYLNRVLVIITGVLGMSAALLCIVLPGTLVQMAIGMFGACGGPIVGMMFLGGLSKKTNWVGAIAAGWSSFLFILWLNAGALSVTHRARMLPPAPVDGCPGNQTLDVMSTFEPYIVEPAEGIGRFYQLSYLTYTILTVIVALVVGFIVSFITRYCKPEYKDIDVDSKYLIPWRTVFTLSLGRDGDKEADKHKDIIRESPDGELARENGSNVLTVLLDKSRTNENNAI